MKTLITFSIVLGIVNIVWILFFSAQSTAARWGKGVVSFVLLTSTT